MCALIQLFLLASLKLKINQNFYFLFVFQGVKSLFYVKILTSHISHLTSHISKKIVANEQFWRWLAYLSLFAYMYLAMCLLGHKGIHFVFTALIFIVLARCKIAFWFVLAFTTLFAIALSSQMMYGKINYGGLVATLVTDTKIF